MIDRDDVKEDDKFVIIHYITEGDIENNQLKIVTFNLRITVDNGINRWENRA